MDFAAILETINNLIPKEVMAFLEPIIAKISEFISGLMG